MPSTFNLLFKTNSENHSYNTRFATNFNIPNNKLEFGKKSISYQGVKIWNNIPKNIKYSGNIKHFKDTYKKVLACNYVKLDFIIMYSDICKFYDIQGVWD